jgi:hypothetical protein
MNLAEHHPRPETSIASACPGGLDARHKLVLHPQAAHEAIEVHGEDDVRRSGLDGGTRRDSPGRASSGLPRLTTRPRDP